MAVWNKTVYIGGQGEITEKKSRFIATICPVHSEEEALAFIETGTRDTIVMLIFSARRRAACEAVMTGNRRALQGIRCWTCCADSSCTMWL